MSKLAKGQVSKRVKRPPVDWSKVPVVIEGTPDPEALRLLWQSVRESEEQALLKKLMNEQRAALVEHGSISS